MSRRKENIASTETFWNTIHKHFVILISHLWTSNDRIAELIIRYRRRHHNHHHHHHIDSYYHDEDKIHEWVYSHETARFTWDTWHLTGYGSSRVITGVRKKTLQWRHNERNGDSNHRRLDCLHIQWKISKLRVSGLYEGNPPTTDGFPSQSASNAESVSIWWRQHDDAAFDSMN